MVGASNERRSVVRARARAHTESAEDLTSLDTTALFTRWRAGDLAARDRLLERYSALARSLARRYMNTSESYEDLCQVAQLGLVMAAERFDPDRGFGFQAFAIPTILGELRRHFRDCTWSVHVPRSLQERSRELRETERMLSEEHGRAPTVPELALVMEVSTEEVLEAMRAQRGFASLSLDAPRSSQPGEEDDSFADTLGEEDSRYELVELRASAAKAIATLEPREREILRLRFFEEMTQSQIALRMGVSQMQVSRLLSRCLEQLGELVERAGSSPPGDTTRAPLGQGPVGSRERRLCRR